MASCCKIQDLITAKFADAGFLLAPANRPTSTGSPNGAHGRMQHGYIRNAEGHRAPEL